MFIILYYSIILLILKLIIFYCILYIYLKYQHGLHRSNAEVLINKVPIIEVDGVQAVCDGGGGALGHPIEYIQLNLVNGESNVCKYCGLRFRSKHHH